MSTTVYLVRHAQAQPLPEIPEPDWALSSRGAEQAVLLVPILTRLGIHRLYSSPFRRAVDTVTPFARAADLELQIEQGLRERTLSSAWIGDFRDVWHRSWNDLSYALEGGESGAVCRDRMVAAVRRLTDRHAGETLALASHGYSIGLLLTTLDPDFGGAEAGALRTPELLRLVRDGSDLSWDRSFQPGPAFDRIATHFRATPGIVA